MGERAIGGHRGLRYAWGGRAIRDTEGLEQWGTIYRGSGGDVSYRGSAL